MARVKRAAFKFKPFSTKQKKVLTWWMPESGVSDMDGLIADGSIRSGKTVSMALSFALWAMESFQEENFAMCGKTIGSFRRNVLAPLKLMLLSRGYKYNDRRTENLLEVRRGDETNYFYIFGGRDERSQDLIQGITLAGVLFDEVALMPESFVNQATGRCSVDGSKYWFNCNPANPSHWFKKEWIDRRDGKRLLYLHFCMDDNLSLAERVKERYRAMYAGTFYDRYIKGLWVAAEGVIYRQFADNPERYIIDTPPQIAFANIGVDFGGNNSAHAFTCTGLLPNMRGVVTLDEYHSKEALDPAELENKFVSFVRRQLEHYNVVEIYADSAEQVLIRGFRNALARAGIGVPVRNAIKGAIVDRIRLFTSLIGADRYKVMRNCEKTVEALSGALWNAKKLNDERLDDGTTNIDSLDAMEYSVEKYQKQLMTAMLFRER